MTNSLLAVSGALTRAGIGINSITNSIPPVTVQNNAAATFQVAMSTSAIFSLTGYGFVAAVESGDGANANNFNVNGTDMLQMGIWL